MDSAGTPPKTGHRATPTPTPTLRCKVAINVALSRSPVAKFWHY